MQLSFNQLWEKSKRYLEQGYKIPKIDNFRRSLLVKKTKVKPRLNTRSCDPELKEIWHKIARDFFPEHQHILKYSIHWSKRPQKRTLASCNITHLKVVVARELNYPEYKEHLEPLIYHEMCHAAIGVDVPNIRGKRQWHGRTFKNLEKRHPQMQSFDHWVKSGGWHSCVRSDRGKRASAKRWQKS